jgi:hypothetical protein
VPGDAEDELGGRVGLDGLDGLERLERSREKDGVRAGGGGEVGAGEGWKVGREASEGRALALALAPVLALMMGENAGAAWCGGGVERGDETLPLESKARVDCSTR